MGPWTRLPCALWLPPACGPALGCRASCQSSPLWTPCQGPPLPVPPPWATLPGLLGASCLLAQARGPSLGRLVTAPGPSFPPSCVCPLCALQMGIAACLLCQHQLEPSDRDGRGREAPAASRPGARGSCPSMGVWSGLASGQLPTYDPAAHPQDCQANARQGSGTSKDSPRQGGGLGKGQHSLPLARLQELPGRSSCQTFEG